MRKWLKYVKPYWHFFLLGPLCMIIEVIGEVIMPRLFSIVLEKSVEANGISVSLGIMALMILCAGLMMAGGIGGAYFGARASVNFAADLRQDAYNRIQDYSFSNIDKFSTGSIVTRLTNDVTQMQNFVNMLLRMALRAPGMMIGGLVMAIILRPDLSLVFLVSIPVMIIMISGLIRLGLPRFGKMQKKIDALNSTVRENITNVRVVKSFVREDFEVDKFEVANGELKESGIKSFRVMIFIGPVMTLIMNLTLIAVIWLGQDLVLNAGMKPSDLAVFVTYTQQILNSLMMVTFLFMMSSRALASAKRISEILDEKTDISDVYATEKEKTVISGNIEFKNVSFRYFKNSTEKVLDNINLIIPGGSTVGIIGSTGCGKTTLVSMIPRLYDTDEGEVLVDGVNVRDYSLKNLRDGVGMVLQKNLLFSGTISDNLRWGKEDATEEELKNAASHAAANTFVSSFPMQYETELEKGGANVSGGQKQRLCIARALLKEPKILILDDSTSAVDTATERQIRESLRSEIPNATKIIIAQRISSVKDADSIIVMNEGKITGIGTHDELIKNNVEYQEIYYSQIDKEDAAS